MIWQAAGFFSRRKEADNHAGLSGVMTHENGIHLYKSPMARYAARRQLTDYAFIGFGLGFMGGVSSFWFLPFALMAIQVPRKLNTMTHFCWHAELLPHTEQVVFHKTSMFGKTERFYADIRNLEKIDSTEVVAPLMWEINTFDPELCFRDTVSREIFVFDKEGFWNKDALEHPLLY